MINLKTEKFFIFSSIKINVKASAIEAPKAIGVCSLKEKLIPIRIHDIFAIEVIIYLSYYN